MVLNYETDVRNRKNQGAEPGCPAGPVQRIGKNGDYVILQIDRFFTLEEIWQNLVMILKPHMVSDKTEAGWP